MTTPITRRDLEGLAENPGLWTIICNKEEARLAVLQVLADLSEATTPFVLATLEAAVERMVVRDRFGDIGIIQVGKIHYPETKPLTLEYATKHYGPFEVLHSENTQ